MLWCSFLKFQRIGIISVRTTKLKTFSIKRKKKSTSSRHFPATVGTLWASFNFIKLYMAVAKVLYSLIVPGNGTLIREDTIFVAPKFCFFETRHLR